jgi:hypothetical protein
MISAAARSDFASRRVARRIDQGAGIPFNLRPNGDYLHVRTNALENNLVLFEYEKGNRSSVKWTAIRRPRAGNDRS